MLLYNVSLPHSANSAWLLSSQNITDLSISYFLSSISFAALIFSSAPAHTFMFGIAATVLSAVCRLNYLKCCSMVLQAISNF